MTTEFCEIVITADSAEWLAGFTRSLVEDKLVAAAHNIAIIRSIYRRQGKIEDRSEARVALHTRSGLLPAIVDRTKAQHPYQVPGIVALPIIGGSADYLAWIAQETRAPDQR
jgi:periplasmic divalent cation tolerance protein